MNITTTRRDCVVIVNNSNIAGYLNNCEEGRGKLRIDYSQLLAYAANGRNVVGALCVSQCDPTAMGHKGEEYRKANRRFLYSLQAFNWHPVEVEYDSVNKNMEPVAKAVYEKVCDLVLDFEGNPKIDLSNLDLVFITGSNLWEKVIKSFADNGLSIEILYPKKSTSSVLYSQFIFRDLMPFIQESNAQVMARRMKQLELVRG